MIKDMKLLPHSAGGVLVDPRRVVAILGENGGSHLMLDPGSGFNVTGSPSDIAQALGGPDAGLSIHTEKEGAEVWLNEEHVLYASQANGQILLVMTNGLQATIPYDRLDVFQYAMALGHAKRTGQPVPTPPPGITLEPA